MRINALFILFVPALLLSAVIVTAQQTPQAAPAPQALRPPPLTLTSTAFSDSTALPPQYSCSAKPAPMSPPLAWTNVPDGTASFAIIFHDMEPRDHKGIEDNLHWMIWNIPGNARSLPENVPQTLADLPDGSRQSQAGKNPNPGYKGACPPMNVALPHHYTFELFALDQMMDVPVGASRNDLLKAMDGHVLGHAVLVSLFHR